MGEIIHSKNDINPYITSNFDDLSYQLDTLND
jgi:hypothetical protein